MRQYIKFLFNISLLCAILSFSSCLEDEKFDGLTDNRPTYAVTFPGRSYDQNGGLVFISNALSTDEVSVSIELEGGSASMGAIEKVEARAGRITPALTCSPQYREYQTSIPAGNARTFTYTTSLSDLTAQGIACQQVENLWVDFIFTIRLSDGSQVVSMPARVLIKQ